MPRASSKSFLVLFFKKELFLHPAFFALAAMLLHLCAVLPMLARQHFDPSTFIVAGDRFVATGQTASPIIVQHHSDGYDGQFYYRLAISPTDAVKTEFGVTLDHPAWRMQRILLPLLARLVAGGQAQAVPAALFAVNLAGIFAIGWLAMLIARSRQMALVVPIAIVAWPGLIIALTHDTTEILAAALLLGGIAAWLSRRFAIGALLFAATTLTRETSILVIAGLALVSWWRVLRPGGEPRAWRAASWSTAALLPYLAWSHYVTTLWSTNPQAQAVAKTVAHNMSWPLVGVTETALANLLGAAVGLAHQPRSVASRAIGLLGLAAMAWFSVLTARVCLATLRSPERGGLAAGWLLVLALISVLTADGPWIEPTAYYRAFTECWVLGWVLLGAAARAKPSLLAPWLPLAIVNIAVCWIQLRVP